MACCATGQNGDPCFTEQAVAGARASGATVKKEKEKENRSSSRENGGLWVYGPEVRVQSRVRAHSQYRKNRVHRRHGGGGGGASLLSLSCSLDGYAVHADGESLPVGTKRGLLGECEAHGVMEVGPG